MTNEIIFLNNGIVLPEFYPAPAKQFIPDWYKQTPSFHHGKKEVQVDGTTSHTIKKCVPVFDAITAGYIIPTWADIYVRKDDAGNIQMFPSGNFMQLESHPLEQAPLHPKVNTPQIPKFNSPWGIKTPKGYSCLFIPPMHQPNPYFSILEGIVDTDVYTIPVLFPFVLKDLNFEGIIPAGTPMAQVIPFAREDWRMRFGTEREVEDSKEVSKKLFSKWFDKYRNFWWHRKSFN